MQERITLEKNKNKSALHKGHRTRMKQRYAKSGIESFQEHEILELLLFFAIPYKDTNALSHELINAFGSMTDVMNAPIQSLKSFKNMTDNAALLLNLVSDICKNYSPNKKSSDTKAIKAINKNDIKKLLQNKYYGVDKEIVSLILLDNKNNVIDCMTICYGTEYTSEVILSNIVKIANSRNVSHIMIAHNHPDNAPVSTKDIVSSRKALFYLKGVGIELCENFVLTDNRVFEISKIANEMKPKNISK